MFEFWRCWTPCLDVEIVVRRKIGNACLGLSRSKPFFSSDEEERWSGVGHAHGVRNQCTSDEFWSTSSVRQVP